MPGLLDSSLDAIQDNARNQIEAQKIVADNFDSTLDKKYQLQEGLGQFLGVVLGRKLRNQTVVKRDQPSPSPTVGGNNGGPTPGVGTKDAGDDAHSSLFGETLGKTMQAFHSVFGAPSTGLASSNDKDPTSVTDAPTPPPSASGATADPINSVIPTPAAAGPDAAPSVTPSDAPSDGDS